MTRTRARWCEKPDSCSIRFDRGFEFPFPQSKCISIFPQYGDCLHISALIASSLRLSCSLHRPFRMQGSGSWRAAPCLCAAFLDCAEIPGRITVLQPSAPPFMGPDAP